MKSLRIFIILISLLLLTACAVQKPSDTIPSTISTEVETSVTEVTEPEILWNCEQAMIEGFLVMRDGDVLHNQGNWFAFLESAKAGEPAEICVMDFTYTENGSVYNRYDLSHDGKQYVLQYEKDGELVTEHASDLTYTEGELDGALEPYDRYQRYTFNDLVLYQDLIAEPDYTGVTEIRLHEKEGHPPVRIYSDSASVEAVLDLLKGAEYLPVEPDYMYCMKLIMNNAEGTSL